MGRNAKSFVAKLLILFLMVAMVSCNTKKKFSFKDQISFSGYGKNDVISENELFTIVESGTSRLKIRALRTENIKAFKSLLELQISNLSNPGKTPYQGVISNKIACPREFKPIKILTSHDNSVFTGYLLFANSRFTGGECTKEEIKFNDYWGLLSCKNSGRSFILEYFVPYDPTLKDKALIALQKTILCAINY